MVRWPLSLWVVVVCGSLLEPLSFASMDFKEAPALEKCRNAREIASRLRTCSALKEPRSTHYHYLNGNFLSYSQETRKDRIRKRVEERERERESKLTPTLITRTRSWFGSSLYHVTFDSKPSTPEELLRPWEFMVLFPSYCFCFCYPSNSRSLSDLSVILCIHIYASINEPLISKRA